MKLRISPLLWIILVSFLIRLFFIVSFPIPLPHPVGDDGYYEQTGRQLLEVFKKGDWLLREFFSGNLFHGQGNLGKYGLEIPWGIFKRGPVYPLFIAFVWWVTGVNPYAIFIAQAFLVSMAAGLLYGIGKALGQPAVGLWAAALMGIYPPLTFVTARIQQESLTIFLFCLFYFLLFRYRKSNSAGLPAAAGGTLLLLILTRSSLIYFPLALASVFGVAMTLQGWRPVLWRPFAIFGFSFLLPCVLWMGMVASQTGRFGPLVLQAGGQAMFPTVIPDFHGWKPDLFLVEKTLPEARRLYRREGIQIPDGEESLTGPPDSELTRAAFRSIFKRPVAFLELTIHKFRFLWWQPHDRPWGSIPFPTDLLRLGHRILVVASVMGALLWFFERPVAVSLLLSSALYGTLFHSLTHIETRYGLIFIPFLILFASFFFHLIWAHRARLIFSNRKAPIFLGCLVSGAAAFYWTQAGLFFSLRDLLDVRQIYHLNQMVQSAILIVFFLIAWFWLRILIPQVRLAVSLAVTALLILIPFEVDASSAESGREWKVPLGNGVRALRQEIFMPQAALQEALKENLRIDLSISKGGRPWEIRVNGQKIGSSEDLRALSPSFPFDGYPVTLSFEHKKPSEMRQWHSVAVPSGLLKEGDFNTVEIRSSGDSDAPFPAGGMGTIYGDYPPPSPGIFEGPLFGRSPAETSIVKYVYDGDFRLNGVTRLHHGGVRSSYDDSRKWHSDDLSPKPGIQTGEYRIRIEVERPKGKFWVY